MVKITADAFLSAEVKGSPFYGSRFAFGNGCFIYRQVMMGILTHCNSVSLATSILGTATAPLYPAHQKGVSFRVYADETRPLLQGARLTCFELRQAGIDVTLI